MKYLKALMVAALVALTFGSAIAQPSHHHRHHRHHMRHHDRHDRP